FQAEDGIRDFHVTGVQTCALPISGLGKTTSTSVYLRNSGSYGNVSFHDMQLVGSAAFYFEAVGLASGTSIAAQQLPGGTRYVERSEERRVGQERRWRGSR